MRLEIALMFAFVSGISTWSSPECRRRCGYGIDYVCSTKDEIYDNECMLKCDWAVKQCDGRCPCYRSNRPVPVIPVSNSQNFWQWFMPVPFIQMPMPNPDRPSRDCYCSSDKDYVCTYDHETYDNECEALCDGKVKACDGPCPCT
ncbi:hypothetical protein ACF0H5_009365 [Mactra antiquata]